MATSDITYVQLPLAIELPLTRGYVAIIDEQDADLASFKWTALLGQWKIYAYRGQRIDGVDIDYYLHRLILQRVTGLELSFKDKTDHVDGDSLNNTRRNLRLASHSGNLHNRGKQANNSSGYKGVSLDKRCGRWHAEIACNNKRHHLGYFGSAIEAALAYDEAARELHGEFAHTNFPE